MTTPPDHDHLTADVMLFATIDEHATGLRERGDPFIIARQAPNSTVPDIFVGGTREQLKALMRHVETAVERAAPARVATPDRERPKWEGGTK